MSPVVCRTEHDGSKRGTHSLYRRERKRKRGGETEPGKNRRTTKVARRTEEVFPTAPQEEGYLAKRGGYVWTLRPLSEHQITTMNEWVSELTVALVGTGSIDGPSPG